MRASFRALRNRNYRLYFYGQIVSTVGTWMQSTVQAWLVYRLSNSAWWLGAIAFSSQVPAFVLSPFAGVVADRVDRRKILIAAEYMAMLQAVIMAALVFTGKVTPLYILILSTVLGIVTAFEITTRHAFAIDLVGRDDLHSAITLNSVTINAARVVGPAIGGIFVQLFGQNGEGWSFLLNGFSYIAIIYGLKKMTMPNRQRAGAHKNAAHEIVEGISYVRRAPRIRRLLATSIALTFSSAPIVVLMPIFARDVLQGNADTLAWLTGAIGLGAVLVIFSGTLNLKPGESVRLRLARRMAMIGTVTALLALSRTVALSVLACCASGYLTMSSYLMINNSIQLLVEDRMRGRVLSLYTMCFLGASPLGCLLAGWISDHVSVEAVASCLGLICLLTGLIIGQEPRLRSGLSRLRLAPRAADG